MGAAAQKVNQNLPNSGASQRTEVLGSLKTKKSSRRLVSKMTVFIKEEGRKCGPNTIKAN